MSRIRTIKPEFPQSETTGKLSRDARLLFVQLWTLVDDEGRTRAASRMLASLLYPYDDDARDLIDDWLSELEREGCLIRYEVEGSTYLEICNWLKHQKIDHPSKSKLPAPRESMREIREPSRTLAPDLGPRTKDQEGKGKKEDARERARVVQAKFDDRFWSIWPNKVGKEAAIKSFCKVHDEIDAIEGGIQRYIRDKPPDRPWLNPATFLNQRRWEDQPAEILPSPPRGPPAKPYRTNLLMEAVLESQRDADRQEPSFNDPLS